MNDDVAELVRRVRGDQDRRAEQALCARFLPVARVFFRRHAPATDVEDLVHEALLVLLTAAREGRIDDDARAGGFLLGVCRNLVRRRARTDERWERAARKLDLADVPPPEPLVDRRRLWGCVNLLGARAREVIVRSFVDELDGPAIAAVVATTEGNVRVVRHRALQALYACLEGERS